MLLEFVGFFYLLLLLFTVDPDMIQCIFKERIYYSSRQKKLCCVHKNKYVFLTLYEYLSFYEIFKRHKKRSVKRKHWSWLKSSFELKEYFGYTLVIAYKSLLTILYPLKLLNRQTFSESTGERWCLHECCWTISLKISSQKGGPHRSGLP